MVGKNPVSWRGADALPAPDPAARVAPMWVASARAPPNASPTARRCHGATLLAASGRLTQ